MTVLRGYAILFNRSFDQGNGAYEVTQEGSFASMIECGLPCQLQATHDADAPALASITDGTLTLFEDAIGLGFEARIEPTHHALAPVLSGIVSGTACRCSVNFTRWKRDDYDDVTIVSDACIDHIAIVSVGAYADTLCWRADTADLPWHIQQWADKWEAGYDASLAKPPVMQRVKAAKRPLALSADALQREEHYQKLLAAYEPHRMRSTTAAPSDNEKRGPFRTSLELHKQAFNEIDKGKTTVDTLLEITDELTNRVLALEALLEPKQ